MIDSLSMILTNRDLIAHNYEIFLPCDAARVGNFTKATRPLLSTFYPIPNMPLDM